MFSIYCFTLNILFFSQQATQIYSIFISLVGKGLLEKKKMDNGNTKESN